MTPVPAQLGILCDPGHTKFRIRNSIDFPIVERAWEARGTRRGGAKGKEGASTFAEKLKKEEKKKIQRKRGEKDDPRKTGGRENGI